MPKESGKAAKAAAGPREAKIYLGPVIPGAAVTGTVYKNGLTPQMKKAVDEVPAIGKLLVGIKDAAKARKELRDPASAVSICYEKAVEYAKRRAVGK